jgi:Domain of unknown function (DUF1929)
MGGSIANVTMMALSAVTHGFNMGQRIVRPPFSLATGGLNVPAPAIATSRHRLLHALHQTYVHCYRAIWQRFDGLDIHHSFARPMDLIIPNEQADSGMAAAGR